MQKVRRGYRGYGKFQEEKNDVIGSNENNYLVVKLKSMFITRMNELTKRSSFILRLKSVQKVCALCIFYCISFEVVDEIPHMTPRLTDISEWNNIERRIFEFD